MKTQEILTVRDLNVSFNAGAQKVPILEDINFEVEKGQVFGITGQSGSGKSMTALSLIGLTRFYPNVFVKGTVIFKENDVLKMDNTSLSRIRGMNISLILQNPEAALNAVIRCGDQICESISIHNKHLNAGNIKEKVIRLLDEVGLNDSKRIFDAYPHELSGGQQQRVVIAMAIANNPDIIIADEATSSLDANTANDIIKLLLELKTRYGTTLIFITHDVQLLLKIADRIMIMEGGKIVANVTSDPTGNTELPEVINNYVNESAKINRREAINENDNQFLVVQHITLEYVKKPLFFWGKHTTTKVLNDINFTLNKGTTLGIFGESGSGKTSIAKIIVGIVPATSGEILVNGKTLSKKDFEQSPGIRRKIQYVFQDALTSLNPKLTIGEQWMEVLQYHKIIKDKKQAKERLKDIMEEFVLPALVFDKYPYQVSGGQLQRVALIRTLLTEPDLVIFDESLSALDAFNQQKMVNIIIRAQKKWMFSAIFISHDPKLICAMCHKVILLDHGSIIQSGYTSDILPDIIEEQESKRLL